MSYEEKRKRILLAIENGFPEELFDDTELCIDYQLVLAAVKKNGNLLLDAIYEFRENEAIVRAAIQNDGSALRYADPIFWSDKGIVLEAIKNDKSATAFKCASPDLQSDPEIVLAAISSSSDAVKYINPELLLDDDFMLKIIQVLGLVQNN